VLGNRLIGPFVFHNNLTGNTYEAFLRNELPGLLEDIPLMVSSQMYFQHDGAPPHYTRHVREYLNESFPNRWLGRGGPPHPLLVDISLWRCTPTRAMASGFLRFLHHTQRRTTVGRSPLDMPSARRRDLYPTTQNNHKRQTSLPRRGSNHNLSR